MIKCGELFLVSLYDQAFPLQLPNYPLSLSPLHTCTDERLKSLEEDLERALATKTDLEAIAHDSQVAAETLREQLEAAVIDKEGVM